jgi:DNA-binding response OmpR family regulator
MVEQRGFALYVGLSESRARASDIELIEVVNALKSAVSALVPTAESHAMAVVGPATSETSDLDVVLSALGIAGTRAESAGGGVVIDLGRHRVTIEGRDAHLTFKEFSLLQELVLHPGRPLSREHLRHAASTPGDPDINDRTIDVNILRLRGKLGDYPDLIRTVHGLGYRFDVRADVAVVRNATPSPDPL